MTQDRIALLQTGPTARTWQITEAGAQPCDTAEDQPQIIVADTNAAEPFPAALMPATARPGPLRQSRPPDLLPATARLMIAGALADQPHWDGVALVVTPETAHWVHVSASEAISTLGTRTPGMIRWAEASGPMDETTLGDTLSRPETLPALLWRATAQQRLGALIGADLAAARRWWLGREVHLIAQRDTAAPWLTALGAQGLAPAWTDTDTATARALMTLGALTAPA